MKKLTVFLLILLLLTITISGCNQSEAEKDSRLSLIKTTNPSPVQINKSEENVAKDIKKDVMKYKEIYDVAVIKGKKDTLVVYKVKHLHRFRMKQIEKKINKQLEKNYPDENFTVSSDYKIFMEALELKEKAKNPKYSNDKAEKELQKIIQLKAELT
ncbi:YhcN/YlaJ family sporulation lipoprotein [Neobacillus sp. D3-1R]|uniref:YhcN/YlaJ family sporulation lipoprotein n=1 Tax=Neobacillus sp. D3-1R TaxID=3445778 RepID=UPI003FA1589C